MKSMRLSSLREAHGTPHSELTPTRHSKTNRRDRLERANIEKTRRGNRRGELIGRDGQRIARGSHPPVGSRVNHASMLTGRWGKVLSAHSPIKPSRAEGRSGKRMSRLQRVSAGCPNIQSSAARRPVARSKNYKSRQKKGWEGRSLGA